MRYFFETARRLNFTRAADALHVSQPALSKQISLLEDELGVRLFHRTSRTVTLTWAGSLLSSTLKEVFAKLDETIGKIRVTGSFKDNTIRILGFKGLNFSNLPVHISQACHSEMPDVHISITTGAIYSLPDIFKEEEYDVVITLEFELPRYPGCEYAVLEEMKPVIIYSPLHIPGDKPMSSETFQGSPLICVSDTATALRQQKDLQAMGVHCGEIVYAANVNEIVNLIMEGKGITVMDRSVTVPFAGALAHWSVEGQISGVSIVAVWKKTLHEDIKRFFRELEIVY